MVCVMYSQGCPPTLLEAGICSQVEELVECCRQGGAHQAESLLHLPLTPPGFSQAAVVGTLQSTKPPALCPFRSMEQTGQRLRWQSHCCICSACHNMNTGPGSACQVCCLLLHAGPECGIGTAPGAQQHRLWRSSLPAEADRCAAAGDFSRSTRYRQSRWLPIPCLTRLVWRRWALDSLP